MHDENLHITPDPKKGFPQPDIPADEAWNKMASLLDARMPVQPPEPPAPPEPSSPAGGGLFGGGAQFWMIGVGALVITMALIWGVLHFDGRPETSTVVNDTVQNLQGIPDSDTLISDRQPGSLAMNKTGSAETITSGDVQMDIRENGPGSQNRVKPETLPQPGNVNDNNVQSKVVPSVDNTTKDEQKPAQINLTKDTADISEFQPEPLSADADTIKLSDKPVPDVNVPDDLAGGGISGEAQKPEGPGKSRTSSGMPENLAWYMNINGNIGQVVQKEREPNAFYGGSVTAGLWSKKLNAGIETGLGWEGYDDYGSVETNIRIDSIPADTLGNMIYSDTTRTEAYKYKYQYLQVPLFISKQILAKGKFSLDIKTGPVIGIMISDKKSLDYSSGPDDGEMLGTINKDYSRLDISWQWQVIPQFRWNINDRLSFTLSPSCIFYLNNLYDSKNRPANAPVGIGVYGGLIYKFK